MTELEIKQKAVVDANAAGDAAWEDAYIKSINKSKKEQDNE